MLLDTFGIQISSDSYGRPADMQTVLSTYLNTLLTGSFSHFGKWAYDFAPDSKLDTSGLDLVKDVKLYRMTSGSHVFARLYTSERVVVYAESYYESGYPYIVFRLAAKSEEDRDRAHAQLQSGLTRNIKPAPEDKISVNFWRASANGGDYFTRDISYSSWDAIQANYSAGPRSVLDQLVKVTPDSIRGKMLLLYGPAGTGKTTLLCSLAHAWKKWAYADYIIDPEVFLNSPGYMVDVLLGKNQANAMYRLVILEDSGELISKNAKNSAGQALSRLLNLTDGMLGSGRKILIAITTNDKITELHPAVTRPGRCLVNAEIGQLTVPECRGWLAGNGIAYDVREPMTLAELYNVKFGGDTHPLGTIQEMVSDGGQYL